ncbi:MAG TPA: terminase small subunit, partial [Desulfobacterales bacterium]|nr:terminase small subunit [Desulfobacterales bacterium]
SGYSLKQTNNTLQRQANYLLNHPKVSARIAELRAAISRKLEVSAEKVLREFAAIGFSDPRKILDKNHALLPPDQWPDEMARAIKTVKVKGTPEGNTITEVQLWPKTAALDSLSKNLGLYLADNKQRNPDSSKSTEELLNELKSLQESLIGGR